MMNDNRGKLLVLAIALPIMLLSLWTLRYDFGYGDTDAVKASLIAEFTPAPPVEPIKININTATKEELITLPGIGEKKAMDIINFREKNDGFNSIRDLLRVNGIGEATLQKLLEFITI